MKTNEVKAEAKEMRKIKKLSCRNVAALLCGGRDS
jgi:hypothetical protein